MKDSLRCNDNPLRQVISEANIAIGRPRTSKNYAASTKDVKLGASSHQEAISNVYSDMLKQILPTLAAMQQIMQFLMNLQAKNRSKRHEHCWRASLVDSLQSVTPSTNTDNHSVASKRPLSASEELAAL